MGNLTEWNGTLPSKTGQTEEVFDSRADQLFEFLVNMPTEINNYGQELLALLDAEIYDNTETYNPTGYTIPSFVHGLDGHIYRCIGDNVSGNSPGISSNWETYWVRYNEEGSPDIPSGEILTGGIVGGDYSRSSDHVVAFNAGRCRDSTDSRWLQWSAQNVTVPSTASQLYNFFVEEDGTISTDTSITGASLTGDYNRWLGFAKNNSSGNLIQFAQMGDYFACCSGSEAVLTALTSSFAQYDFSSLLPEARIEAIEYGTNSSSGTNHVRASIDGTDVAFYVGHTMGTADDANRNVWGDIEYQRGALKPYDGDLYFAGGSTNDKLLVHMVKMRR